MKLAKAFLFVVAIVIAACAVKSLDMTTYPVALDTQVWISSDVRRQVDSMALLTGQTREEQAMCVTSYRYVETERGRAVKVDQLGPANLYWSDSLNIYVRQGDMLCGSKVPVFHTHIIETSVWGQPSPLDSATAANYFHAPFHLVLSVRDTRPVKLTFYALR